MSLARLLFLSRHLYLSGVWLGVFKIGHHKDMCVNESGLHAQNLLTVPGSIVNIIGVT